VVPVTASTVRRHGKAGGISVAVRGGRVWVHADWFPYSDGDLTAAEATRLADLLHAAAATATRQTEQQAEP
jgi:hypothetical protein